MTTARIHNPRRIFGYRLLILILTCAFGAALVSARPLAAKTTPPLDAVYFTDLRSSPLSPLEIATLGLRPVTTVAALQVESENARMVVIDRALLPLVPPTWLAQQYRREVVIFGLNIPMVELARLGEYSGGVGGYLEDYGGRPFYADFYQLQCGSSQYGGSGSDYVHSTAYLIGVLQLAGNKTNCAARPTRAPTPPNPQPRPTVTATPLPRSGP